MQPLSLKQEEFCRQYVVDLNGKEAAIRAKYSPKSAKYQAVQLLKRKDVQQKIAEFAADKNKETAITAREVINSIAEIARDESNKVSDRLRALEVLAKHFNLFSDFNVVVDTAPRVVLYLPERRNISEVTIEGTCKTK